MSVNRSCAAYQERTHHHNNIIYHYSMNIVPVPFARTDAYISILLGHMIATSGIAYQAVVTIDQIKNQQLMILNLYLHVIVLISPPSLVYRLTALQ